MNLVMHGDGSSNVFHDNSLLSHGEWLEETRERIKDDSFDVVITNPPFGEDLSIDDSHLLSQYELSSVGRSNLRAEMAPQELFIERCHRLLKNNGILIVVTPDNIVSNPSYRHVRNWIFRKFQIYASISLPMEMFQPHTGTQTSLLVLKKLEKPFLSIEDLKNQKGTPVFMSVPKKVGHDQRGNLLPARDETGSLVLQKVVSSRLTRKSDGTWENESLEHFETMPDDQLPLVMRDFDRWFTEHKDSL